MYCYLCISITGTIVTAVAFFQSMVEDSSAGPLVACKNSWR